MASSVVGTTPLFARSRALRTTGSASRKIGPEASPVSPRLFSATVVASENGVRVRVASVSEGAALPRSEKTGVAASEKPCRLRIVRRNSRRKVGNLRSDASSSGPLFGAGLRGGAGVGEEAGDVGALAGERPQDRRPSRWQLGEAVALGGEDAEEAVDVAQDRVGALDQDFEVVAATGQAGAEFVEDEPEALRVGQRLDVVDQVRVDAGAVAAERQQVLARPGLAGGDLLQRRRRRRARRPRQGRAAVDELLADQRLRPDLAAGVAAEVLEAGVGDVHDDDRLAGNRDRLAVLR